MLAVLPTENWGECSVNRPNRPPTALPGSKLIRNATTYVRVVAWTCAFGPEITTHTRWLTIAAEIVSIRKTSIAYRALLIRNAAAIVTVAARMHACIAANMRKNTYASDVSLVYPGRIDAVDGDIVSVEL